MRSSEPPLTRFIAEQLGTAHWFDQRAVQQDLGWTPHVSLDEGFQRLTQWFASR
jgi:nucleoside-diphosphate-sugar epimerase